MSRPLAPITPAAPERARLIADFYAVQADRLCSVVARKARAPAHAAEDACHNAWAILLRRPDITLDARGFAWLTVVATREIFRTQQAAGVHGRPRPTLPGHLHRGFAGCGQVVTDALRWTCETRRLYAIYTPRPSAAVRLRACDRC